MGPPFLKSMNANISPVVAAGVPVASPVPIATAGPVPAHAPMYRPGRYNDRYYDPELYEAYEHECNLAFRRGSRSARHEFRFSRDYDTGEVYPDPRGNRDHRGHRLSHNERRERL